MLALTIRLMLQLGEVKVLNDMQNIQIPQNANLLAFVPSIKYRVLKGLVWKHL